MIRVWVLIAIMSAPAVVVVAQSGCDDCAPPVSGPQSPPAVTPEPSGVVLLGTGLVGLVGMRWRRR